MTRRITTTAAVAAAGATLAFGAYGIGSQVGDGDATAASAARAGDGPTEIVRAAHPHHDIGDLADQLGVSESRLGAALDELRTEETRSGEHHIDVAAALADALGKSADEVEQALEGLHGARHTAFAAALAGELGVEADKVAAALEENRPEGRRRPSFAALAKDIGVSRAKLRAAFRGVGREFMPGREGRDGHRAALAEALDVTEAQLEAAFEKLEATAVERHELRRAAFAKKLAGKLGISADRAEEALAEAGGPFAGPPGRHGHGPGPGGPEVRPFGGRP